jgi:hypothetical protein
MGLGSFFDRVIPAAIGAVTGGPVGAFAAASAVEANKTAERRQKAAINTYNARSANMFDFGNPNQSVIARNLAATRPVVDNSVARSSGGFSGFLDTVTQDYLRPGLSFLGEFGGLFNGGSRPRSAQQGPAITTVTNVGAAESQGSGSIQAGAGALLPSILGGARSLLKSPLGQLALGTGGGLALSGLGPDGKRMRITRKMKSQARTVLNLNMGNIPATADMLNISEDMLIFILLKRFRNDGPVVTKAALRKTKQTVRRLKNMCDMYDSLRPTATRRKTPMRRSSTTTLIKN